MKKHGFIQKFLALKRTVLLKQRGALILIGSLKNMSRTKKKWRLAFFTISYMCTGVEMYFISTHFALYGRGDFSSVLKLWSEKYRLEKRVKRKWKCPLKSFPVVANLLADQSFILLKEHFWTNKRQSALSFLYFTLNSSSIQRGLRDWIFLDKLFKLINLMSMNFKLINLMSMNFANKQISYFFPLRCFLSLINLKLVVFFNGF